MIQKRKRKELYDKFRQGAIPSGADFADFIRSQLNLLDDGIDIPEDEKDPLSFRAHGDEKNMLDFSDKDYKKRWRICGQSEDGAKEGFNLKADNKSLLYVERETGNVGINTDQPIAKLHIKQTGSQDAFRVDDEGNDETPFVITSDGNIGIGIGAGDKKPLAKLHINSPVEGDSFRVDDTNEDTTPFVINEDGNVGIGFSTTKARLSVNGGVSIGDANKDPGANNLFIKGNLEVQGTVVFGGDESGIGGIEISGPLTAKTEELVIKDNVSIIAGTSTSPDKTSDGNLSVQGNTSLGTFNKIPENQNIVQINGKVRSGYDRISSEQQYELEINEIVTINRDPRVLSVSIKGDLNVSGKSTIGDNTTDDLIYLNGTVKRNGQDVFIDNSLRVSSNAYFLRRLGIGTTTPTDKLHILSADYEGIRVSAIDENLGIGLIKGNGDGASSAVYNGALESAWGIALRNKGDGIARHIFDTKTGNVYISGNTGIGTATPAAKLEVSGKVRIGDNLENTAGKQLIQGGNITDWLRINGDNFINGIAALKGVATDGGFYAGGFNQAGLGNFVGTGILSMNGTGNSFFAGNVGIGVTAPTSKLEVSGQIKAVSLETSGDLTVKGNLFVQGETTVVRTERMQGNVVLGDADDDIATIEGSLTTGHSSGRLKITPAVDMASALNVAGLLTLPANGLAVGNNQLYCSNNKAGIGTTTPGYKLEVKATETQDGLSIMDGTRWMRILSGTTLAGSLNPITQANDNGIFFSGGNQGTGAFVLAPWGNSSGLRMDSNGNVGIGIAGPGAKLDVAGRLRIWDNLENSSGKALIQGGAVSDWLRIYGNSFTNGIAAYNGVSTDGGFYAGSWTQAGAGNIKGTGNLSMSGTGDNYFAGRVGIGTASPGAKLSFNNLNDSTDGADGITWYSPSPLDYGIYRSPGKWTGPDYQQLVLSWSTGMVLNPGVSYNKCYVDIQGGGLRISSGNVGIGTTAPAEKLDVVGNIRFNSTISTPGRMHVTGEEYLYLLNKSGVIIGKEWGGNGSLTVQGNLNVTGTQNICKVHTQVKAVANNSNDTPASWSISFSGFAEIYTVFAVFQGFSLWNNNDNTNFGTWGHSESAAAIPQHVFVKVSSYTTTSASGTCFCSESRGSWAPDNTILFTVVVIGRGI